MNLQFFFRMGVIISAAEIQKLLFLYKSIKYVCLIVIIMFYCWYKPYLLSPVWFSPHFHSSLLGVSRERLKLGTILLNFWHYPGSIKREMFALFYILSLNLLYLQNFGLVFHIVLSFSRWVCKICSGKYIIWKIILWNKLSTKKVFQNKSCYFLWNMWTLASNFYFPNNPGPNGLTFF